MTKIEVKTEGEKEERARERERLVYAWPQWPGLGQAKARKQEILLCLPQMCRGPSTWSSAAAFQGISAGVGEKVEQLELEPMPMWHVRILGGGLHHSIGPFLLSLKTNLLFIWEYLNFIQNEIRYVYYYSKRNSYLTKINGRFEVQCCGIEDEIVAWDFGVLYGHVLAPGILIRLRADGPGKALEYGLRG